MKFYIEAKQSNKTGKKYVALFCDTGYSNCLITCDSKVIMEIGNITPAMYHSMAVGEKIDIK